MKASGLNEFNNFFTSFPAWMKQLTNAFLLPYSNGYTERTNNKIKVLKQISYGLRHFGRFRVRIPLLSKRMAPTIHMRLYNKCWGDTTTVSLPTLFFCKK